MGSYFARQPIMDSNMNLYAYELLYRKGPNANFFTNDFNEDHASSSVLENLSDVGIEKITGGKKAFVNFTYNFLTQGIATLFPKDHLVVEVLENVWPSEDTVESVKQIKEKGYLIALDDFEYHESLQPLVDLCDIIKVDFAQFSMENIRNILKYADLTKVTLLAEKVETQEEFQRAKTLGFKLFQGYFFSKPVIMESPKVNPIKMNYIQLIRLTSQPEVDFFHVSQVVRRDLSLAFKLLRLVNSPYFGFRNKVYDIQQAIVALGERELKKWVSLVSMMGLSDSKPSELVRMSMVRARFCELSAVSLGMHTDSESLFITGMFSLIDAIMDAPLEEILSEMVVPELVKASLADKTGKGFTMIQLLESYEKGDWEQVNIAASKLGFGEDEISQNYTSAVTWCDQLMI